MKVHEFKQIYWSDSHVPHTMTSLYFPKEGVLEKIPFEFFPTFEDSPMAIQGYNYILKGENPNEDYFAKDYAKNRKLEYVKTLDLEEGLVMEVIKSGKEFKRAKKNYERTTREFMNELEKI